MKYKIRPGIVSAKICGVNLLIPNRAASEYCPRIQKIGLIPAAAMEVLEKGESIDKIYTLVRILGSTTDEEARRKVDGMLEDLFIKGYLVEDQET